jgi:hypothetical protein
MDTDTLLKIIESIDIRLSKEDLNLDWAHEDNPDFWDGMPEYNVIVGHRFGLNEIKDYLQECIEQKVNQAEDAIGAGE